MSKTKHGPVGKKQSLRNGPQEGQLYLITWFVPFLTKTSNINAVDPALATLLPHLRAKLSQLSLFNVSCHSSVC